VGVGVLPPRLAQVLADGALLTKGSTWGEDIILSWVAPNLCRPMHAKAINYTEVYLISPETLDEAVSGFPMSAHHIRRCALRLAMRRQLLKVAAVAKRLNTSSVIDLTAEDFQRALQDAPAARAPSWPSKVAPSAPAEGQERPNSFKRSKTLNKMLSGATSVSSAEASLQTHLINVRRQSTHPGLLADSPVQSTPSHATVAGAPAPAASGWVSRQSSHSARASFNSKAESDSSDSEGESSRLKKKPDGKLADMVARQELALGALSRDVGKILEILKNAGLGEPEHKPGLTA